MTDMQERFKRAFEVLEKEYQLIKSEDDYEPFLDGDSLCLRWLRNEAKLWEDYEEDNLWIINGVDYNPNHPDNLSDSVYKLWLQTKKDKE